MDKVYIVYEYDDAIEAEPRVIGVYATESGAKAMVNRMKRQFPEYDYEYEIYTVER